jgi:hypothetical protein
VSSRPLYVGNRPNRKSSTEPVFVSDTPDLARRRKLKARREERDAIALDFQEHEGLSRRDALREADEVLGLRDAAERGEIDLDSGELTRKGRRAAAARGDRAPVSRASDRARSRARSLELARPRRALERGIRRTGRNAVKPFGDVAGALWTFTTGGLSLVLLYTLLREAGAVSSFGDGLSSGFRRFGDPYTPLFPTAGEAAPPSSSRIRTAPARPGRTAPTPRARARAAGPNRTGPYAGKPAI